MSLYCKICGKKLKSTKSMSHVKTIHNMEIKEYYDKFLRKDGEGFCFNCKEETKFLGVKIGYQKFCSLSCSNKNINRTKQ